MSGGEVKGWRRRGALKLTRGGSIVVVCVAEEKRYFFFF